MTDHSELKRLAEAATQGEWVSQHPNAGRRGFEVASSFGLNQICAGIEPKNALYIAAANPDAVLALIAETAQSEQDYKDVVGTIELRDIEIAQIKAEVARSTEREIMQLAEIEALRKELASLKSPAIRTDKTTIGYTGCIVCGEYTSHGSLQCPNLAARSLSMENQRIVPVEPIRIDNPLDAAISKGVKP